MNGIRLIALIVVVGLIVVALAFVALGAVGENGRAYNAELGPHEGVETQASGEAAFRLDEEGTELSYELAVADIENVTVAHIHLGREGEDGPVVLPLFDGPRIEGLFSGTLAEGTATAADLRGPLQGQTLDDLVSEIEAGNAYVNVHTERYPAGEIRGQIR